MPSTGTPEPDGFLYAETLDLLRLIRLTGRTIIGYAGGLVDYEGLNLLLEAAARDTSADVVLDGPAAQCDLRLHRVEEEPLAPRAALHLDRLEAHDLHRLPALRTQHLGPGLHTGFHIQLRVFPRSSS